MSKILWINEPAHQNAHEYLQKHLRANGATVVVRPTRNIAGQSGQWTFLSDKELWAADNAAAYDAIVISTHNGNPHVRAYQQKVKPKLGYIDIEHDIFGGVPEFTHPRIAKPLATLLFTAWHQRGLKSRSPSQPARLARWFKLDQPIDDVKHDGDPEQDAVVIGSHKYLYLAGTKFEMSGPFRRVWMKKFMESDPVIEGCEAAPPCCTGLGGVPYLPQFSKFWFAVESSCYVEALMFGCIPILWSPHTKVLGEVDDIISSVEAKKNSVVERLKIPAIVPTDIDRKIKVLREDPQRYQETLAKLSQPFLFPDMKSLPTTVEVLTELCRGKA